MHIRSFFNNGIINFQHEQLASVIVHVELFFVFFFNIDRSINLTVKTLESNVEKINRFPANTE